MPKPDILTRPGLKPGRGREPALGAEHASPDGPDSGRRVVSRLVDRFGAFASFICAVHCALLPIVFGVLPALGLAFLADHAIERAFVAFAIAMATTSLLFGLRRHGSYRAFGLLVPGIVLLLTGLFVGADHADVRHAVLVSIGGTLVALSHLANLRLDHVHGPDCRH